MTLGSAPANPFVQRTSRRPLAEGLWAAGIALAALLPLAPAWLAGKTFVCRDSFTMFAPIRHLVGDALRHGRLPLWNPFSGTGQVVFAELMHGVLHPISVAAAFLFPSDALDPLIGANVAAAAVGAAVLARVLGASRAAAAGAGIAYGLSGFTLSMAGDFVCLVGAGSLPWLVAGIVAAAREARPVTFAAAALAAAVAALSGDVQAAIVGTALGALLAMESSGWRGALRALAAVALGLALTGAQLVPSWRHLAVVDRGLSVAPLHAAAWTFAPWRVVELLTPGFFVQPEAGLDAPVYAALGSPQVVWTPFALSAYVGLPVIALAAAGLAARRTCVLLGAAALGLLWFATGDHLGADRLLALVPLVRGFRYTEKYLGPVALCLSMLAALGLDRIASERKTALRVGIGAAVAVSFAGAIRLVLGTTAGAALLAGIPQAEHIAHNLVRGLAHPIAAGVALAGVAFGFARGRTPLAGAATIALLWVSAAAASSYALRPGRRDARTATPPPSIAAALPGPRFLHVHDPAERTPAPGFDAIDQRSFDAGAFGSPNLNVPYATDAIEGWTGLRPLRYLAVGAAFDGEWPALARRYGATHAIFPPPRTERGRAAAARATAGGERLAPDPRTGAEIWSVPHRPWASFPPEIVTARDADEALGEFVQLMEQGSTAAVVEADAPFPAGPGRIVSVSRGVEDLRIDAEAERDAALVVNDAFSPGWRATIDGREVPVHAADVLVRAVRFPAGRHVLEMTYEAPGMKLGALLSGVGALALAAACVALRARRRRGATGS